MFLSNGILLAEDPFGGTPPCRLPGNLPLPPQLRGTTAKRPRSAATRGDGIQATTSAVLTDRIDDEDDEASSIDDTRGIHPPGRSSGESGTSDASLAEFRRIKGLARELSLSRNRNDPTR